METTVKIKIVEVEQDGTLVLENSRGDTFTIKSEDAVDFFCFEDKSQLKPCKNNKCKNKACVEIRGGGISRYLCKKCLKSFNKNVKQAA